jgi:ferric-dicitrate binding protein FerR (iron transport regulator)
MFTKQRTDWSLLAKYLAGETGDRENAAMEEWLDKSPGNRALLGKLKSDWKIMDNMNMQFNVDNAWNKLHGRIITHEGITGKETGEKLITPQRRLWFTPVRIAASLLLMAAIGVSLVFITKGSRNISVSTASNERQRSVLLPDGTEVFLNSNTRINYAKKFDRNLREVTLSGEAFFEVAHDKSRPFIIHADQADIRVVGTSFNIDARDKDQGVEVYVSTGVVELYQPDNTSNHVLLHPGDMGTIRRNQIVSKKSENENPIAWKTGNMDFQDTRLSEAVRILNEIYRVNIVCRESELDTTQTNGTYHYPEESLDQILTIICKQNHLKIEKSDNNIYLTR